MPDARTAHTAARGGNRRHNQHAGRIQHLNTLLERGTLLSEGAFTVLQHRGAGHRLAGSGHPHQTLVQHGFQLCRLHDGTAALQQLFCCGGILGAQSIEVRGRRGGSSGHRLSGLSRSILNGLYRLLFRLTQQFRWVNIVRVQARELFQTGQVILFFRLGGAGCLLSGLLLARQGLCVTLGGALCRERQLFLAGADRLRVGGVHRGGGAQQTG